MKHKIFLITYKGNGFVEGFVYSKKDFIKWLSEHNKERKRLGELREDKTEFDIKQITELI